jgi:hypothetical protein
MRIARLAGLLALAGIAAGGCQAKPRRRAAHRAPAPAAALAPTPDTTPVAALRTPAGWLLLRTETPAPATTPPPSPASRASS